IGVESGPVFTASSYVAMHLFEQSLGQVLEEAAPRTQRINLAEGLSELKSTLTPSEIAHVRTACCIAKRAYGEGIHHLQPGPTEADTAVRFRRSLSTVG